MQANHEGTPSLAQRVLAAGDNGESIPPLTTSFPSFSLAQAYRVSAHIAEMRERRGERRVGWKIGFTNRTIWDEYGVHAPIWGPMYATTLQEISATPSQFLWTMGRLVEPRIEPEIMLRISATPAPAMSERELLACCDGIAHGFEMVQSIFPSWKFKAEDTVAAFALHGAYRHGPIIPLAGNEQRDEWFQMLSEFEMLLSCNRVLFDRGQAANVLGGPLSALRHFVQGLEGDPFGRRLVPGDLVTTGTVTRAMPVKRGETWSTRLIGLPLPGLEVSIAN
jgi:2-keto-4-pentenoate hydratase